MRKVSIFILMFIMLAWVSSDLAYSRTEFPQKRSSGDKFIVLPNIQNRAHTANNLWLCISNWGVLGSEMGEFRDPETDIPLPSSRFPKGSDLEYLWLGSIWIGAIVNDTPYVSVGHDGWQWVCELWPDGPAPIGAIVKSEWLADQEFIAIYTDTSASIPFSPSQDPWGPHHPLDIRVTQHSYVWQTPGYNDFVILDYTIKNIGNQLLSEPYIGFYIDADIQHADENGYGPIYGAQDDITGFLGVYNGDTVNIAWAADNDGHGEKDGGAGATQFIPGKSPTAVVGMRLLGASTPGLQLSYNWLVHHMSGIPGDWGPWKQANQGIWAQENCYAPGDSFFPDHALGTPGGDCSKYFLMSNGEIDYDQIYSCVNQTAQGWLPPNDTMCGDLANGYDQCFVFSFGPFNQLAPGESLHFAVAWVAGDSFHVDPLNLQRDPNMLHPDTFYSHLNFSKLVENSEIALSVYQSGYTSAPPGPPENLSLCLMCDSSVGLTWSPKTYHSLLGYNLYRSTVPGEHNDPPINSSVITAPFFIDTGLPTTEVYYYAISSVTTSYLEGCLSPDLEITVGRPFPPTGLTAEGQNDMVTLSWQHSEDDVIGYKIYRTEDCSTYVLVDSVGWQNVFWDHTVINGIIYYYRITAVDSTQLESFPSDTVWALPMAFDQEILVLDQTNAKGGYPWSPFDFQYGDSVDSFYNRALQSYEFAVIHHDSCQNDIDRVSLPELSPFQVCILHYEDLRGTCGLFDDSGETILKNYLRAGGKLIIEGREALFNGLGIVGPRGWHALGPYWWCDFAYDWLRMDSAYLSGFAPPFPGNEFVGARSEVPEYPDLDVDTWRVNGSIDSTVLQLNGKLPGICCFIPRNWQETIYTFRSAYPETSSLEGMPVAIRHLGADHQVIFFCFPLYFIQEDQATQLLHQALTDFGFSPTDVSDQEEGQENIPTSFTLKQNYPNPFNPQTIIEYVLPKDCELEIAIYNILGRKVRTLVKEFQKAGLQRIEWDGKDEEGKAVSSGIYFYRIKTPEFSQAKKMVLLR